MRIAPSALTASLFKVSRNSCDWPWNRFEFASARRGRDRARVLGLHRPNDGAKRQTFFRRTCTVAA
jgi:hypothetical protein